MAEADVASASRFRLKSDGVNHGLLKSSGLIVSTGLGSSNWLSAARQIFPIKIEKILNAIGVSAQQAKQNEELANAINLETNFGSDEHRMFFFVREGFALKTGQITEGFCKEMEVTCEMLNGEVILDGWWKCNFSLGEVFTLKTAGEEQSLTNMRLLV